MDTGMMESSLASVTGVSRDIEVTSGCKLALRAINIHHHCRNPRSSCGGAGDSVFYGVKLARNCLSVCNLRPTIFRKFEKK